MPCVRDPSSALPVPFHIEDKAKELGANFVTAGKWTPFAVQDGNLITGQWGRGSELLRD